MEFQDQLQRQQKLNKTPERIISLVPSQTELLVDLGLEEKLLGVTKFCVHPATIRKEKKIVGGTKEVKIEEIKALQPDLILCNKEENTKKMVKELEKIAPVHVSDIHNLEEAYEMIQQYGEIFSVEEKASILIEKIQQEFLDFQQSIQHKKVKKVAYFIWRNPWMVAGGNTFINYLLNLNKFENVYENMERYPAIKLEELREVDYLLLSSEPFPFHEKYIFEFEPYINTEKIKFVDGEYFSWYGSRLKDAFQYFKKFHAEL
ncbi:ABC transporter substrate-binding protein [Mesonia maritima]|uniref:ABC-type Fe3+-hydroxamate transport system substrate-binding protein n=1 Tax=Mesonia maritima TaxID=1793873 RepID=A0ABU1K4Q3_9FLAO|nr:helical backbone metal receptor [Mesonia maritima]MDR6300593.1 ABC-type Fe3+-hydroxamate transport system substrate-binding protein [Mesonia maritima]